MSSQHFDEGPENMMPTDWGFYTYNLPDQSQSSHTPPVASQQGAFGHSTTTNAPKPAQPPQGKRGKRRFGPLFRSPIAVLGAMAALILLLGGIASIAIGPPSLRGGSTVGVNATPTGQQTQAKGTAQVGSTPSATVTRPSPTTGITVTPQATPTLPLTPTPIPSATPTSSLTTIPETVLALDTFNRADQQTWGSATDGQMWQGDATQEAFSIAGNMGIVSNGSPGQFLTATLGPQTSDSEAVLSGSITSFSNANFGIVLRLQNSNNWYKAFLDGSILGIEKRVNGVVTLLNTTPFQANTTTSYTIRFRAIGSTLEARAWQTTSTEPTQWLKVHDTSFSIGVAGIRVLVPQNTQALFSLFAEAKE